VDKPTGINRKKTAKNNRPRAAEREEGRCGSDRNKQQKDHKKQSANSSREGGQQGSRGGSDRQIAQTAGVAQTDR
jgi:hypothetical protein